MASEPKAQESDIDWEPPAEVETVAAANPESTAEELNEKDLPPAARNIVVESGRYPELPEIPPDSPLAETAKAGDKETEAPDAGDKET